VDQILSGLRVVEGAAFVAAPSGAMTLAQLGADVIRFDLIGGGLDYRRWPVDARGNSLFWAGLNKGKRSIAVDFRKPEGQELLTRLIAAPGEDGLTDVTLLFAGDAAIRLRVREIAATLEDFGEPWPAPVAPAGR